MCFTKVNKALTLPRFFNYSGLALVFNMVLIPLAAWMWQIVILQCLVLSVISAFSAFWQGWQGLFSSVAGGGCYLIPTVVSVLFLRFFQGSARLQSRMFAAVEALKIMLSLILMVAVFAVWHQSLAFLPFLAGLIGTSHLVSLVLLRVKNYGR